MKKFLAAMLVILLVLSMGVVALAAGISEGETSGNIGYSVLKTETGDENIVYYLTFDWTNLSFVYTINRSERTWDPTQHIYLGDDNSQYVGTWSDPATIKVYNHSNTEVTVTAAIVNGEEETLSAEIENFNVALSSSYSSNLKDEGWTLATAEGTTPDTAPFFDMTLTVYGDEPETDYYDGSIIIRIANN